MLLFMIPCILDVLWTCYTPLTGVTTRNSPSEIHGLSARASSPLDFAEAECARNSTESKLIRFSRIFLTLADDLSAHSSSTVALALTDLHFCDARLCVAWLLKLMQESVQTPFFFFISLFPLKGYSKPFMFGGFLLKNQRTQIFHGAKILFPFGNGLALGTR